MEKKSFCVTFGQKSPFRKGWVEVKASSFENALEHVNYVFGTSYSNIYAEDSIDREYFPAGRLGEILEAR